MKNILKKININYYTYFFILVCFLCGYIKNIFIIFSVCFIHELGHVFFIKLFHYKIVKIELLPFGGFTLIDKHINTNINKDLLISIGGVIFQLILISIIIIFKNNINIITYNLFIKYNIILIIFNLIPIVPLDGNNIVHLLLEKKCSYHNAYKINSYISILCLIIFIIINYIYKLDNYFIISFLIYKIIMYIKNYKYLQTRFLLERVMYNIEFSKIDNNTLKVDDLRKEVFHYFKRNNKYINEKDMIKNNFIERK